MDVKEVLGKIATITEKRKGDLTRSFNAIFKKKKAELEDVLEEDQIEKMSVFAVGKKYGIKKVNIEGLIKDSEDDEEEEEDYDFDEDIDYDDDEEEEEEEEVIIAPPPKRKRAKPKAKKELSRSGKVSKKAWADFFASIPEPKEGNIEYEKLKGLVIQFGINYTISLVDPAAIPYEYKGNYGPKYENKAYTKWVLNVILHKVSPEEMYDEVYSKGEHKGEYLYDDGEKYSLWLTKTAMKAFGIFFSELTDDGDPDDRKFVYKRVNNTEHKFSSPRTKKARRRR